MTTLTAGTELPETTIDAIYNRFQFRHVCDNERFQAYFNSKIKEIEGQYMLLLRNDLTEWDPMVSEYLERQIRAKASDKRKQVGKGSDTTTHSGSDTSKNTGKDTEKNTGGRTHVLKPTATRHETLDLEKSGREHDEEEYSVDMSDDETRDFEKRNVDERKHYSEDTGQEGRVVDKKQLNGDTPDSQTYGTGSSIGLATPGNLVPEAAQWPGVLHEVGAPDKLDWKFASAQAEGVELSDGVSRGSRVEFVEGDVFDRDTGGGTVHKHGWEHRGIDKTFDARKDHEERKTWGEGEDRNEMTQNLESSKEYGKVVTDEYGHVITDVKSDERNIDSNSASEHRERYSGRRESPQELLDKARAYILKSNSLTWLFDQLETCFFKVFAVGEIYGGCDNGYFCCS